MRSFLLIPAAGGIILAVLLLTSKPSGSQESVNTQERVPKHISLLGHLPDQIRESSGVASSRSNPEILWTHNDSGGDAVLYAISLDGSVQATYPVDGARNRDWEDIAHGPCHPSWGFAQPHCLYIADTGDNAGRRGTVSIYVVAEPSISSPEQPLPSRRIRVTYPDGHPDVEALAVDPVGNVVLISKGFREEIVWYTISSNELARDSVAAVPRGPVGLPRARMLGRMVTGAAFSPDGNRLVARTYLELYFFRFESGALIPDGAPCFLGAAEPQGEAVDFLDEREVVLTSEALPARPGTIYRVEC